MSAARAQIGVTTGYDPSYVALAYPGGDVPIETGVCSDVVVRAFRSALGVDLQQQLHEDMVPNRKAYPKKWGQGRADANIDHRRVLNLMTFFGRKGRAIPVTTNRVDYLPGDVVSWTLPGNLPHMGIVSDRVDGSTQNPLIIHNIGAGAQENDILFSYPIVGHARW